MTARVFSTSTVKNVIKFDIFVRTVSVDDVDNNDNKNDENEQENINASAD